MKNGKRILSVTIKRMADNDPDTSYLGKYGRNSESKYAIDRKHTKECNLHTPAVESLSQLGRIYEYLSSQMGTELREWDDSLDLLNEKMDELNNCSCDELGYWSRGEMQYFNPNWQNYEGCADAEIREYCWQDYERMESYNNGSWCYIGIRAEAEIFVDDLSRQCLTQRIKSGGLWGIESESDVTDIEKDELSELAQQLKALGFSQRAISKAFKNIEHKSE